VLVEFAIILPIFLLLILGQIQVSIWQRADYSLLHAATQGAIAGAEEPAVPRRCDVAEDTAERVLGHAPTSSKCTAPGNLLTLELTDAIGPIAPIIENFSNLLTVRATARATVR
jgi:Flp pilus assembly protein TadG